MSPGSMTKSQRGGRKNKNTSVKQANKIANRIEEISLESEHKVGENEEGIEVPTGVKSNVSEEFFDTEEIPRPEEKAADESTVNNDDCEFDEFQSAEPKASDVGEEDFDSMSRKELLHKLELLCRPKEYVEINSRDFKDLKEERRRELLKLYDLYPFQSRQWPPVRPEEIKAAYEETKLRISKTM